MTGFSKPLGFAVFPRSVVAMGFVSDATSYHGDSGLCQRLVMVTVATQ